MRRSATIGLSAVAAVSAFVSFAFVSAAAADNLDGMVGNTAVCKVSNGGVTKVFTGPGGAYTVTLPNGQSMQGTAKDDGKQICYVQATPATTDPPVCVPSVARKAGDTWTVQAQGASQDCALVAGRQ